MGGSGSGYSKESSLTKDELRRRHREADSDAYLFDEEYEKLKKEQDRLEREYRHARDRYMRVSERLKEEMAGGAMNVTNAQNFIAGLTEQGVMLQQQQAQMLKDVDAVVEDRIQVDRDMDNLRRMAFPTETAVATPTQKDYRGFENKSDRGIDYADAKVVEMSPEEYLRRVAFGEKGNGMRDLIEHASPKEIEKYARQMLRGTKFNAPSLNNRSGASTGASKVWAALMNGYSRIPVMIIE